MATSHTVQDFRKVVVDLKEKYQPFHEGLKDWNEEIVNAHSVASNNTYNLHLPPWLCQPYLRMAPEDHIQKLEIAVAAAQHPDAVKRQFFDEAGNEISRKKMKKLRRVLRRPRHGEPIDRPAVYCKNTECTNTMVSESHFFQKHI
jgi:tRNA-dihydrouridine synthase 1